MPNMKQFAPCPKCNGTNSEQMSFTWWGGIIGPKILTHVKCNSCGETYNGKTGKDNKTNIIIYSVVVGLILAVIFIIITAITILIMMN
jgi:predicted nucleic-acid-binding Zn-ribbon protein